MDTLRVKKIFHTIQSEGVNAGVPALFIRLAGCNLKCYFCDTDFSLENTTLQSVGEVYSCMKSAVDKIGYPKDSAIHVVVTGGEPFKQQKSLIELLRFLKSWRNQFSNSSFDFETNGLYRIDFSSLSRIFSAKNSKKLNITISPKKEYYKAYKVFISKLYNFKKPYQKELLRNRVTFKLIVGEDDINENLKTLEELVTLIAGRKYPRSLIYLQAKETSKKTQISISKQLVDRGCFGYRLSFQTHKIIGVE